MALTIGSILAAARASTPHRLAVTLGDASMTFDELHRGACRTANALTELGCVGGDRVAFWSETSLRSAEVFGATAMLGAPFAPLNPRLGEAEVMASCSYLRPRLLIADAARASAAAEVASSLSIELSIVGAAASAPGSDLDATTALGSTRAPAGGPDETDVHAIYLTSGSTGAPKGVVLSHRASWLRCSPGGGTRSASAEHGGHVSMFPLFHWAGWHMATESWQRRYAVHLVAQASAEEILAAVERWRAGSLYCIPAVWNRILSEPAGRFDTTSLRFADTGTSAVPSGLLDAIRARFPMAVTSVNYGSTEAGATASLAPADLFERPESVGRAVPMCTIRLAEDGEIEVQSVAMMDGYFERPGETAAVLRDSWYRSGDLGELDADGYLTVTGRKHEIIRTGGEWVSPIEVESALAGLPGLQELAVVGTVDPLWGETICAVVVPAEGHDVPDVEALRGHLASRLAPHKHPRHVVAIDAMPRTAATGQVRRALLVELLVTQADRVSQGRGLRLNPSGSVSADRSGAEAPA